MTECVICSTPLAARRRHSLITRLCSPTSDGDPPHAVSVRHAEPVTHVDANLHAARRLVHLHERYQLPLGPAAEGQEWNTATVCMTAATTTLLTSTCTGTVRPWQRAARAERVSLRRDNEAAAAAPSSSCRPSVLQPAGSPERTTSPAAMVVSAFCSASRAAAMGCWPPAHTTRQCTCTAYLATPCSSRAFSV